MILYVVDRQIQTYGSHRLVQGEHKAEPLTFKLTMENASGLGFFLSYMNEDGEGNSSVALDKVVNGNDVSLTWEPTQTATNKKGKLMVQLYAVKSEGQTLVKKWMTYPVQLIVNESLDMTEATPVDPSVLDTYLARFENLYAKTMEDASDVIDEEAEAKIEDIATAKNSALSEIESSASGYTSAITSAKNGAISEVEASASGYEDMITSAKEAAVSEVGSAKSSAISDMESSKVSLKAELVAEKNELKEELGNYESEKETALDTYTTTKEEEISNHTVTKKGEITSLTETKKSEITSTTSTVVGQVTSEGTTQKALVTAEGATQVAAVQSVYQSDLGAIASDCAERMGHLTLSLTTEGYLHIEKEETA